MASTNATFVSKKAKILASLSQPEDAYKDLSPKGTIDTQIQPLVDSLNARPNCVTLSSCAGRISCFVEGSTSTSTTSAPTTTASAVGGKGGDGHWLFVTHDPLPSCAAPLEILGLSPAGNLEDLTTATSPPSSTTTTTTRLIHLKFEPLILHVLTDSLTAAHRLVSAAQQAGYRESGVTSVASECPMVAVRTAGLALESVVGYVGADDGVARALVTEEVLGLLLRRCNARFGANEVRKARLVECVEAAFAKGQEAHEAQEDKEERWRRKRAEGLARQKVARELENGRREEDTEVDLGFF